LHTLMSHMERGDAPMSAYEIAMLILVGLPIVISIGKFAIRHVLKFLDDRCKK